MNASQLGGSGIAGYIQSATLTTSGSIEVPQGTKRVEALLCGGGGGGSRTGGGFGGLQVYEISPVILNSTLTYVIGGGGSPGNNGGITKIESNGITLAAVGGGGCSGPDGGVGTGVGYGPSGTFGGAAGGPPQGNGGTGDVGKATQWFNPSKVLWDYTNSVGIYNINPAGMGAGNCFGTVSGNYAGCGQDSAGSYGGGGGGGQAGGTMTGVSIWGLTGYAGSTSGGGGMLAASSGANGGNGGGGGGGNTGTGGAGFIVFRFYY